MSSSAVLTSIRRLRTLLAVQQGCEQSDAQLLTAFVDGRDEIAFATLMRRYGPMVLGVCRRVLGHVQDAEDAYQATFLVLARNAAALRNKTSLANFLHGTAYRTAMKAKQTAARRRKHEGRAPTRPQASSAEELSWREVRALLDEEIARLPEIYQSVFVLCVLEDLSRAEAAQRLGLKERTVLSRLAEARKRLQKQLILHGVELSSVLAMTVLATPPASALSPLLIPKTLKAALAIAAGEKLAGIVSASVAELVRSATAMMSKAKIATVLLLTASILAVAISGSLVGWHKLASGPLAAVPDDRPKAASPTREAAKVVEIQGRVLDPDDKPVKGARLHSPRLRTDPPRAEDRLEWVDRGRSDADGRFRITLADGEDVPNSVRRLVVTANGHGLAWVELPAVKASGNVTVRMRKDVPIRGRILSTEGRPLAGVRVHAERLQEMPNGRLDDYLTLWGRDWFKAVRLKTQQLPLPAKQPILPPVVTDQKGCFQLSGMGSERIVHLAIQGKGIANASLPIVARPGFDPSALNKSARRSQGAMVTRRTGPAPALYGPAFDYVALPERIVEGVVREAGSGKPIAGVRIHGLIQGNAGFHPSSEAITDTQGRYRLEGLRKVERPASLILRAVPPPDSPWLSSNQPKVAGEGPQSVQADFALGRGVVLTGRVIDRATSKGVVGILTFDYLPDNKFAGKPGYSSLAVIGSSENDGRFRKKVAPGTGVLSVMADGESIPFKLGQFDADDRKHITFARDGNFFVAFGGRLGFLTLQNAVKRLDLAPDAGVVEQNLYLERGATAKVRIQDPQGKPLSGVLVSGIDSIPIQYHRNSNACIAPEAECTIVALEPSHPRQVVFYHAERHLAGALVVRGDEKGPLTVRLAPTGAVTGRLRNADGEPLPGAEIEVATVSPQPLSSLRWLYMHLNSTRLPSRTDKEGRFRLEGVIHSEKFALGIRRRGAFVDGGPRTKQLQVKAGETLDLGDIRIKAAE